MREISIELAKRRFLLNYHQKTPIFNERKLALFHKRRRVTRVTRPLVTKIPTFTKLLREIVEIY